MIIHCIHRKCTTCKVMPEPLVTSLSLPPPPSLERYQLSPQGQKKQLEEHTLANGSVQVRGGAVVGKELRGKGKGRDGRCVARVGIQLCV